MKKTLLILVVLATLTTNAQTPITSYFGNVDYNYTNLNPATALSHTTTGANVVWSFNSLPTNGTSAETNTLPTPAEIVTYPNTTSIHNVTTAAPSPSNNAKIYSVTSGTNSFSFTGFDANGIILNYSTNNATLGVFPLNYGFTNTDTIGGTFIYGTNNGTFTGTIKTDYDSYGTLNLDVTGFDPIVKSVFRVKVVQNINLSVGFPVGTIVQTTYTYYINEGGSVKPFFRDTTYVVNVPLLSINQTTNQAQVFTSALTLGTSTFEADADTMSFYPNPANNILTIDNKNNTTINSIVISDTNGRNVLETKNVTSIIDISNLSNGIYFVRLISDFGIITKKLVKE